MTASNGRNKLTAIDLFSGCGGMTEGLKQAGFSVRGAVEIDPLAAATYKLNHKRVKVWQKDIRKISPTRMLKDLKLRRGEVDLLTGCPPCQGFSSMRRLNGSQYVRDARNDLLFDFLRFVRGIRPKAVMFENVPGLQHYWRWPEFRRCTSSATIGELTL